MFRDINEPGWVEDTWRDMGHMSNLSDLEQKRGKMGMREKKSHFSCSVHESEREEEREASTSLHDLRSSVAWFSSSQKLKFIYATRATRGYQKQGISPKIHTKSSGYRGFRVSETSRSFVFTIRGRISSYFGLFSILGAVWLSFNALRGCLALFFLRGCLEK